MRLPAPLLASLLLACAGEPEPEPGPEAPPPWEGLEAVALDPFRELVSTTLAGAEAPGALLTLPERSLTFALDSGAVLVLDARYHHDPAGRCVDASSWSDLLDDEARGDCPEGSAWTRRGRLVAEEPTVAMAVDRSGLRIGMLGRSGALSLSNTDVLQGNPLHWLRPGAAVSLQTGALSQDARLAIDGDLALVADGEALWVLSATTGERVSTATLPGAAQAVAWGGGSAWALTEAGLWRDGAIVGEAGLELAIGPDAAWVSQEGGVYGVDLSTGETRAIAVEGSSGPLAIDEGSGRLWLAVDGGVATADQDGELARYETDAVLAMAMNSAHELVLLHGGGAVSVYADETELLGPPPLRALIAAFIERPRTRDDDTPCRGADETVTRFAAQAVVNRPLLEDQPLPVALGLTPQFARRAADCRLEGVLQDLLESTRLEVGVLFHDLAEGCEDTSCIAGFLAEEAAAVEALAGPPRWVSGLSPQAELGLDWVEALEEAGLPSRYLFFGMSTLPDLAHETDPRAKDPWPVTAGARSAAWRVASAETVASVDPDGWLILYPGDNTPAFNLGDCPNLLLRECHLAGAGGGPVVDADDVATLRLLLHRAVAERADVSTWTFHLPDLGVYPYTDGCEVEDRAWSGEGCQAAVLQGFAFEVYQRYVKNGLVSLDLPSELAAP